MKVIIDQVRDYNLEELKEFFKNFLKECEFFLKSKSILLKPNLLQASPPEKAITTHPVFIEACIIAVKELNPECSIYIGDSPGANFINYEIVLKTTGIMDAAKKYNVEIVKFEKYAPKKINDFIITSFVDKVDCILNLAKLKTHSLTGLTLCVKNLFGLVPGTNKVGYHKKYPDSSKLAENIYQIYEIVKDKTLSFLDGILAHEGEGPSRGKPVKLGIVGASVHAEALDMVITNVLGFPVDFCKTNLVLLRKGINLQDVEIEGKIDNIPKIRVPISTKVVFLPNWFKRWFAEHISVKPEIDKNSCIKCFLCYKSCPVNAINKIDGFFLEIDKDKCIECFCCYEVCESDAINLKRSLLHKVIAK
ncbi:DUF362 domain-containing protein [Deferribacter autotrophicus]|uniref:DUF362 domain-containing protein n=1 Tax=Deferribacter autotrophicus TaxID=500465 RepID=A0A5A8F7Z9_9BACT|nr:DUF362 domain-containing protein [Deferribacter autotrophicus]KAA0259318.1 DUF362 domain-containing protein [Deferribacter autotrophicus]